MEDEFEAFERRVKVRSGVGGNGGEGLANYKSTANSF